MARVITLGEGAGGKLTHALIRDLFWREFANPALCAGNDAGVLPAGDFPPGSRLALSTDSFVVSPPFFPGGDIGRLAVSGTVNDLLMVGSTPLALSVAFILEEGFPYARLEAIVRSIRETAAEAGVTIITGDTKVVGRGAVDGIFLNTAGVGVVPPGRVCGGERVQPGDKVLLTGNLGEHEAAVLIARGELGLAAPGLASDVAPLSSLLKPLFAIGLEIHALRDPTRGGVATTLNEIAAQAGVEIIIEEEALPVPPEVQGVCELLGLDPLYLANEGKALLFLPAGEAEAALARLRAHPLGRAACCIGEVVAGDAGATKTVASPRVRLRTRAGGERILDMLVGEALPRIC